MLALVLPLGLDSFSVAAANGAVQPAGWRPRIRVSAVFVIFEGGMPLIGLAAGRALARGIGTVADYVAAAVVIAIGVWMLAADDDEGATRIGGLRGFALIALGLSISLDELAIGFTIGLTPLPGTTVIAAIAVQAFLAAQLGLAAGAKIGERWRERAGQVAGIALILLGGYLLTEQVIR